MEYSVTGTEEAAGAKEASKSKPGKEPVADAVGVSNESKSEAEVENGFVETGGEGDPKASNDVFELGTGEGEAKESKESKPLNAEVDCEADAVGATTVGGEDGGDPVTSSSKLPKRLPSVDAFVFL
jgi:hypothetical protein